MKSSKEEERLYRDHALETLSEVLNLTRSPNSPRCRKSRAEPHIFFLFIPGLKFTFRIDGTWKVESKLRGDDRT